MSSLSLVSIFRGEAIFYPCTGKFALLGAGTQLSLLMLLAFFPLFLASVLMPADKLFSDFIFSILLFVLKDVRTFKAFCRLFSSPPLLMLCMVSLALLLECDLVVFVFLMEALLPLRTIILLGNVSMEKHDAESCLISTEVWFSSFRIVVLFG